MQLHHATVAIRHASFDRLKLPHNRYKDKHTIPTL